MTCDQFKQDHCIRQELENRGVQIIGQGQNPKCKCPFHEDKNPSLSIDLIKGVWKCHAGCGAGSVIDLLAMFEGVTPEQFIKDEILKKDDEFSFETAAPVKPKPIAAVKHKEPDVKPVEEAFYRYTDEIGQLAYEVVRYKPKMFRQRRWENGGWVWSMEGVQRYLFKLVEVLKSEEVWIVEGEKDALNLHAIGLCGTCNAGGADKWLEGYSDSLRGKKVVICGDNDAPGRKHVTKVFDSLAGKAAEVRVVEIPREFKDVSDWLEKQPDKDVARKELDSMRNEAPVFFKGIKVPLIKFSDIEERYARMAVAAQKDGIDLGKWLPSFSGVIRPLTPGDLVFVLAGTGVGKTTILSNILGAFRKRPSIFYELELTEETMFERLVSMRNKTPAKDIERAYASGQHIGKEVLDKTFPHLYLATEMQLSVARIEEITNSAELVMGVRPEIIYIDYIGLIESHGTSRYDSVSKAAEELRKAAKKTKTVIITSGQISRKKDSDDPEVTLFDAKDSGSIENSSSLLLGAWRNPENAALMHIKVLKQTRGQCGKEIVCDFNGETLTISQRAGDY